MSSIATAAHPLSDDLGAFLRSRRDRLEPGDLGLVSYGRRRVPGLRREELAQLAGVSLTYYTRLEQGQAPNASDAVIEALARALQLDDDEREHLFRLARPQPSARPRATRAERPGPGLRQILDRMDRSPGVLLGRYADVLGWNSLGHRLLAGHLPYEAPARQQDRPNLVRLLFLDAHARDLYRDWEIEAQRAVASLRFALPQHEPDRRLAEMIGDLSLRSPEFARMWSSHAVTLCSSGSKAFRHPAVGRLELDFEVLHAPSSGGQRLIVYTPSSTSASGLAADAALSLLADDPPASPVSSV